MKKLVCYWLVMGMVGVVIAQHRGRDNPDFLSSEFNPKYTASSIMMEEIAGGVRIYAAQNLGRYLYSVAGDATQLVWNQEHLPWMEGAAGNGVGQTIKLSCDKSFSSLSILNGYVDLANPAAFRENSRAKSIRIEDLDNGLVYQLNLSDEIAFTGIQLKQCHHSGGFSLHLLFSGSGRWTSCGCRPPLLERKMGELRSNQYSN